MIPEGLFQLRIFWESVVLRSGESMLRDRPLELVEQVSLHSSDFCRLSVYTPSKELCSSSHLSWIILPGPGAGGGEVWEQPVQSPCMRMGRLWVLQGFGAAATQCPETPQGLRLLSVQSPSLIKHSSWWGCLQRSHEGRGDSCCCPWAWSPA